MYKPCPFCGGTKIGKYTTHEDERSGYNIVTTVSCYTCHTKVSERSNRDKNGWCNENTSDVEERAIKKWNRRYG